MRILHTSDWHLGLSTGAVSRLEDQRCFLDWLARQLAFEEVDALIVAGDIFDSVQPYVERLFDGGRQRGIVDTSPMKLGACCSSAPSARRRGGGFA